MKGTGAKRNVCPGSFVSTGAKFPVAPVESAPMVPIIVIIFACLLYANSVRWIFIRRFAVRLDIIIITTKRDRTGGDTVWTVLK